MRYEPSMNPGANIAPDSSSLARFSWSAVDKRQAGHNPDGEASGLSGAPQLGHDAELVKVHRPRICRDRSLSVPLLARAGAIVVSEPEADFARDRALDQVAEHVFLHGFIEQILSSDGHCHRPVSRPDAEPAVYRRVRVAGTQVSRVDVLPESGVDEAAGQAAEVSPSGEA